MTLRVIFFGNSRSVFSNRHFLALREAPCAVVGVVDVPPDQRTSTNAAAGGWPSFIETAQAKGIPLFKPVNPNLPGFVKALRALAPDLFLAVGYTVLLKAPILSVPRLLAANFHASVLPAYRGKHPVFWALRHGERFVGLTVHVMDAHLDAGDILQQVRVRTLRNDTVSTAYDRIMDKSVLLVRRLIEDAGAGRARPKPQPETGASYFSSAHEKDFRIDWRRPAAELCRWIRTSPGQCFCETASGERIWFSDAEVVGRARKAVPGTLLAVGRTACVVAAGKDALRLRTARCGGTDDRSMAEIARALALRKGDALTAGSFHPN